jgi:hypothetical protein
MNNNNRFTHFASAIRTLDLDQIVTPADIPATFAMGSDGTLTSHYIPFDLVNPLARIVLVGITPGLTQWKNAMHEAQRQLKAGVSMDSAHQAAKRTGAFSGAMRPNLIALLDHIGLHRWLGLASCDALFDSASHLVQTSSILGHPVFVDGTNYNGAPNMVRTRFLQQQIEAHFAEEAKILDKAVFVPLGPKVSEGLDWLTKRGVISPERVLHGLPHPSGANAERLAYFLGRKPREALSPKTNASKLDEARTHLQQRILALA